MRQFKPSSKTTCLLTPEHIDSNGSSFDPGGDGEPGTDRSDGCAQALIVDSMGIGL